MTDKPPRAPPEIEGPIGRPEENANADPDWGRKCEVCGNAPVLPATGMCGPCTFGEADTAGGDW